MYAPNYAPNYQLNYREPFEMQTQDSVFARVLTKEDFESLNPRSRGWVVYMGGCRDDQPNIPDESNPYPVGSSEHQQWERGRQSAYTHCLDLEE